jgi:eukaryotic-like serine/threonine-protein kinase
MQIGEYQAVSPFVTVGSGNARWCVAQKEEKQYFLKQFLAPVQPVQTAEPPTEQVRLRRERCETFERRKFELYRALQNMHGDCVVRLEDFFVFDGHYYAVSAYVEPPRQTFDTIRSIPPRMIPMILYSLAECLRMLHLCGVVHADLKPEHILIKTEYGRPRISLIDFDSGFLESSPPAANANIEVDPAYMAPETYLCMTGKPVKLNHKLDTFALGMLLHQALTGELPRFDKTRYAYLYACVLDGGQMTLSERLGGADHALIQKLLRKNPAKRPDDQKISALFRERI